MRPQAPGASPTRSTTARRGRRRGRRTGGGAQPLGGGRPDQPWADATTTHETLAGLLDAAWARVEHGPIERERSRGPFGPESLSGCPRSPPPTFSLAIVDDRSRGTSSAAQARQSLNHGDSTRRLPTPLRRGVDGGLVASKKCPGRGFRLQLFGGGGGVCRR